MARNEKDLLSALFKAMTLVQEPKTVNENKNDVEKYRDADGYINVKNVKDINELKRVFDIVDKKNYLEHLQNSENSIQDLADALAYELLPLNGTGSVNIKVETPNGCASSKAEKIADELKNYCSPMEKTVCCEKNLSEQANVKEAVCTSNETEVDETEDRMVVLYDVGGMFNPAFYNSVLYICENKHFPEYGVYAEDEVDSSDNVTTHILLPNVWGKIFAGAAEEFGLKIEKGDEVFVIDPESFELVQITTPVELWNFAMTKVQEDSL